MNVRVHDCECGVFAQRELYSAYLARFVEVDGHETVKGKERAKYSLHADQAVAAWSGAKLLLQSAWKESTQSMSGKNSVLASFGKYVEKYQSQNGSTVQEGIKEFKDLDVVPKSTETAGEPNREFRCSSLQNHLPLGMG